jgi:hypothetical protein
MIEGPQSIVFLLLLISFQVSQEAKKNFSHFTCLQNEGREEEENKTTFSPPFPPGRALMALEKLRGNFHLENKSIQKSLKATNVFSA